VKCEIRWKQMLHFPFKALMMPPVQLRKHEIENMKI